MVKKLNLRGDESDESDNEIDDDDDDDVSICHIPFLGISDDW